MNNKRNEKKTLFLTIAPLTNIGSILTAESDRLSSIVLLSSKLELLYTQMGFRHECVSQWKQSIRNLLAKDNYASVCDNFVRGKIISYHKTSQTTCKKLHTCSVPMRACHHKP